MRSNVRTGFLAALCAVAFTAHAKVQHCELNGEHVNPSNGSTTAGKTGVMRCRDGEGGPLQREQELQNGVFMGLVRFYDANGELKREHQVNERGNRDGRAREYEGRQLVLEEQLRNGTRVGLARRWHARTGQLIRVMHHGEDGREQAVAEFTSEGKLSHLRCGPQPLLAPHADDAAWCGHQGSAGQVTLHAEDGRVAGSLVHERGERRRSEWLWPNGKPRETVESTAEGGVERHFADTGVLRRERRWVMQGDRQDRRRVTTLEREHHESGTLVRERQWAPDARGELVLEQQWYLNGQLRSRQAYSRPEGAEGGPRGVVTRRETRYHDNGKPSFEGAWLMAGRHDEKPLGVQKSYDAEGRLRLERHHDERGRLSREREWDASGQLERDDALFEDGSRKAFGR